MKILRDKYSKEPAWVIIGEAHLCLTSVQAVISSGDTLTVLVGDELLKLTVPDKEVRDEFLRAVLEAQGVETE